MSRLKINIKYLVVVFVLSIIFSFLFFLTNKKTQDRRPLSDKESQMVNLYLNSGDKELEEIAKAKLYLNKKSSLDLIEDDYKKGVIDINKYIKLKLISIFYYEYLPKKYKNNVFKRLQGDMVIREIKENLNKLDENTKKVVRPFLLSFKEKGSYFHPDTDRKKILDNIVRSL